MKKFLSSIITVAFCASLFSGCAFGLRIKPGHAITSTSDGVVANAVQSQDPKEPLTQNISSTTSDEQVIPVGSVVDVAVPGTTNLQHLTLSAPMPVKHSTTKVIETKVGSSQKNTAGDIAAKLASVRWIQWIGILVALFGVASLFWPPLAAIVGSPTTSMACIASGGGLIFLPIVLVGHELLILSLALGGVAVWYFAHHTGTLTGELNLLKSAFSKSTTTPAAPATSAPSTTANS